MVDMPPVEPSKPLPPPWDRIFSLGTRTFVWALLAGMIYILRPFFLLIFLTFVFAYIQEHGVQGLAHRIGNRVVRVVIVFVVMLGALISIGIFLAEPLKKQAANLGENYPALLEAGDQQVAELRKSDLLKNIIPPDFKVSVAVNELVGLTSKAAAGPAVGTTPNQPPPVSDGANSSEGQRQLQNFLTFLSNIGGPLLGIGSAFLLSLLFSFLIVLDLPRLSRGVAGLHNTKIGFIYEEAASTIHDFGIVLGRALEAQLFIAICNTVLTALGLYFLDLTSNLVFLSTVVFFGSFIPVAGVFLSSVPICLEALSTEGVQLMVLCIVMILVIHFVEAYFLNPKIFGHHLHMNAVLVLIVLTIGGKLFGVWGLVLGLPIVNYIFRHAIRYKPKPGQPQSAAA